MRPTIPSLPKGLPIGVFAGSVVLAAGVAAAAMPDFIQVRSKVGDMLVFSPVRPGPGGSAWRVYRGAPTRRDGMCARQ